MGIERKTLAPEWVCRRGAEERHDFFVVKQLLFLPVDQGRIHERPGGIRWEKFSDFAPFMSQLGLRV